jgi:hypothetical protein
VLDGDERASAFFSASSTVRLETRAAAMAKLSSEHRAVLVHFVADDLLAGRELDGETFRHRAGEPRETATVLEDAPPVRSREREG